MAVVARKPARPLVVLVSGVTWDGVKGSERHLAEALIEYADVLWVDPPVSPVTPQRYRGVGTTRGSWWPKAHPVAPRLARLTPVVLPGLTRPGVRISTWPLVRAQIRGVLRRSGRTPVAVIACSFDPVLGRWGAGVRDVLYGTDDWTAGAELMGQDVGRLRRQEREALSQVDIVFAVTPELAQRWRSYGVAPVVLPNGCDPAAYTAVDEVTPAPLPVGFPTPVAGVVGQLTNRIEMSLLEAVADTGIGLLLVGPRDPGWLPARCDALLARDNVHHAGAVPFDALPAWLSRMDVGLTPYADTPFNRASFPLKTLEYLAAGRPVVGTELPATARLAEEFADVRAVSGAAAFADAVKAVAAVPPSADARSRRRVAAGRHSWAARAKVVADLLGLGVSQVATSYQ